MIGDSELGRIQSILLPLFCRRPFASPTFRSHPDNDESLQQLRLTMLVLALLSVSLSLHTTIPQPGPKPQRLRRYPQVRLSPSCALSWLKCRQRMPVPTVVHCRNQIPTFLIRRTLRYRMTMLRIWEAREDCACAYLNTQVRLVRFGHNVSTY